MCALFLKRNQGSEENRSNKQRNNWSSKAGKAKGKVFCRFNVFFDRFTQSYAKALHFLLRRTKLTLLALAGIIVLGVILMIRTASTFIPTEDDSFLTYTITMPPGATLARTKKVLAQTDSLLKDRPEIAGMTSISGYNAIDAATSPSFAVGYINLKPHKERGAVKDINDIINDIQTELSQLNEGKFSVFPRPTIQGFGDFSGVEFVLQDRLDSGFDKFDEQAQNIIQRLNDSEVVANAFTSFNANFPQYILDIDYVKAKALGVSAKNLMTTIREIGRAHV